MNARHPGRPLRTAGFTLLELLIAATLASLLLAGIGALVGRAIDTGALAGERNRLTLDARFAMQRITMAVSETRRLILPLADTPATAWREHLREETVPPSPPEPGSTRATAVLAVALSAAFDVDADGYPDADNDRDGRLDEDYPGDMTFDFAPGILGIDDGGDGLVDEGFLNDNDDDERASENDEDPINGIDDDGDGQVDEDPPGDVNGDGAPGIAGVDDDGDGQVDEGSVGDDDEDGDIDEDWLDAHVFFVDGGRLIERQPVPWDETASGGVDGRDFIESVIADNVARFRVERLAPSPADVQLVAVTLELAGPTGERASLEARLRVGASQ